MNKGEERNETGDSLQSKSEDESKPVMITIRKPASLTDISKETLNIFWFKSIYFILSYINDELWIDDDLRERFLFDDKEKELNFDIPLEIGSLLKKYYKYLERFLENEYRGLLKGRGRGREAEGNRESGKEIFHNVFGDLKSENFAILMQLLTEKLDEIEEGVESYLDSHLQNSIESIDTASIFFTEKIPSKLLEKDNSSWRDVSKFLIEHTMKAVVEIISEILQRETSETGQA